MAYWTTKARLTEEIWVTVEAETEEEAKRKFEENAWLYEEPVGEVLDWEQVGSFKRDNH